MTGHPRKLVKPRDYCMTEQGVVESDVLNQSLPTLSASNSFGDYRTKMLGFLCIILPLVRQAGISEILQTVNCFAKPRTNLFDHLRKRLGCKILLPSEPLGLKLLGIVWSFCVVFSENSAVDNLPVSVGLNDGLDDLAGHLYVFDALLSGDALLRNLRALNKPARRIRSRGTVSRNKFSHTILRNSSS
jgi:hypothetical protein